MSTQNYIRYSDDVETRPAGEDQTIADIVATMSSGSQKVAAREGPTVRASHAKASAFLKGELRVLDGLPPELRQGLFAEPRTYPVAVRMAQGPGAQGPGEHLPDSVSTHRGLAIEVLGVAGPKIDFFGHTPRHPLTDTYYSHAALRYGDDVAKLSAVPVPPGQIAMGDGPMDTSGRPDAFRDATVSYFGQEGAEFEIRVQLCTDLKSMPVEDASVRWPEDESPYRAVARLVLPRQDALGEARRAFMNDRMSFRPAHSLAAHRPLGSLMRARLKTYPALFAYRSGQNQSRTVEPTSLDQIPD